MKPVPMPPRGAPEFIAKLDGMATPIAPALPPGWLAILTLNGAATAAGVNGADSAAPAVAATPRNPRREVFFPGSLLVLIDISRSQPPGFLFCLPVASSIHLCVARPFPGGGPGGGQGDDGRVLGEGCGGTFPDGTSTAFQCALSQPRRPRPWAETGRRGRASLRTGGLRFPPRGSLACGSSRTALRRTTDRLWTLAGISATAPSTAERLPIHSQ